MSKRSSMDRDFAVNALRVVERAIGERIDGEPLEETGAGNKAAVPLGKLGGAKGGSSTSKKPVSRPSESESMAACRSQLIRQAAFIFHLHFDT